ncbi:MAG: metal ABC transporter permease [Clostridia bacterium]|nr:metal ABC transporter permease [Clostridia bacterium]
MIEALQKMLQTDFMLRALLAVVLIAPLFTGLGTLVVNNGMSFFSDALGHSALTGVGIGMLLGVSVQTSDWVMIVFAVLFALLMNRIRYMHLASTDAVIGVFSACGVALGLILLSKAGSFARYQSLLIGDILSVTGRQLVMVAVTLAVVLALWLWLFNRIFAVSIHASLARSRGLPVRALDHVLVAVLAVVVMLAIRWVGLLLINAMLILPAAAARNFARSIRSYFLLTLCFSLFSGVLGLVMSYWQAVAAGPMIVLIAGVLFFASIPLSRKA